MRRRSHSMCDAVAAREGRIFKRLHHPVDTRYMMAKDNDDDFKDCAKQRIPTRQLRSDLFLLYEFHKLDKVLHYIFSTKL